MDAADWDLRYAASDLVWSATPNRWVEEVCRELTPGVALDMAAGEGRNAIWLVRQGWRVVAADFSSMAVDRTRELAAAQLGDDERHLRAVVADATAPPPGGVAAYDLVVLCYLQLADGPWRAALHQALAAAAPGGRVVIVLHARENLERGYGGPQDPMLLHDPADVLEALAEQPFEVDVERCELVTRLVDTDGGTREALDTLVVVRRPPVD